MSRRGASVRAVALMSAAAFALHQLRYLFGWGPHAGEALSRQGHGYMAYALALVVALLAAALGELIVRLCGVGSGGRVPRRVRSVWLAASVGLLAIYVVQETLEGLLAAGHPDGLAGVFGHGGVISIPLALGLGAIVALGLRAASDALEAGSGIWLLARAPVVPWPALAVSRPVCAPLRARENALALNLAGRAPPLGWS